MFFQGTWDRFPASAWQLIETVTSVPGHLSSSEAACGAQEHVGETAVM